MLLEEACSRFEKLGDEQSIADSLCSLADMLVTRGSYPEAVSTYTGAAEKYHALHDLLGEAHCLHGVAEAARFQNDFESAERWYRAALRIYEAEGSGTAAVPKLNLGLLLCQKEELATARVNLEEALAMLLDPGPTRTGRMCPYRALAFAGIGGGMGAVRSSSPTGARA